MTVGFDKYTFWRSGKMFRTKDEEVKSFPIYQYLRMARGGRIYFVPKPVVAYTSIVRVHSHTHLRFISFYGESFWVGYNCEPDVYKVLKIGYYAKYLFEKLEERDDSDDSESLFREIFGNSYGVMFVYEALQDAKKEIAGLADLPAVKEFEEYLMVRGVAE